MELIVIKPEFRKLFSDEREHVLFLKEKSDFGNSYCGLSGCGGYNIL